MNLIPSFLHRSAKDPKANGLGHLFRAMREHGVAAGMAGLLLLLIGTLAFDGFVFYVNVLRQAAPVPGSEKKINLSEKGITDVLMLLDARQQKFDEILNSTPKTGHATSSIITKPAT